MSNYVQGHTLSILRAHSLRNASNTCQYFIHRLKPNYKILDVGCGPGTVTATLAELVPQGDVIGVDESEVAIKAASEQPGMLSPGAYDTDHQTADWRSAPHCAKNDRRS